MTIELREVIAEANRRLGGDQLKMSGEIFPGDTAAAIANSRAGIPSAFPMLWGFALGDGRTVINARSETAAQKPMFADGMAQRRCVIPASGYYEWEKRGGMRIRYAIRSEEGGCSWMAGIYRLEKNCASFVILTREPAENIAFIHDRMPVLLPETAIADWLDPVCPSTQVLRQAVLSVAFEAV